MSNSILKGKKGIIFGALDDSSIAWKTAERIYEEGGEFILTNAPVSIRMGTINKLAEKTNSEIIDTFATLEKFSSSRTCMASLHYIDSHRNNGTFCKTFCAYHEACCKYDRRSYCFACIAIPHGNFWGNVS